MAFLEKAQECDASIKDAFQKLIRFEKRVTRGVGALTTALTEAEKSDAVAFERISVMKEDLKKAYKVFQTQLDKSISVFDANCKPADDDNIYVELTNANEKVGVEYAKTMSLYDQVKPVPLTEREVRLQRYQKERDDILSKIQAKKNEHATVKAQLDTTASELKEIEDQFKKLNLVSSETDKGISVKNDPDKKPDLFNYNSTPK